MALEYAYRKITPTTEVFFPGSGLVPQAVAQKPASFQERKLHFKAKVAVEKDEARASSRLNVATGLHWGTNMKVGRQAYFDPSRPRAF